MEIILLDRDFKILHMPIDDFTSLQWQQRWTELGSFELHLSREYFAAAKAAQYIYQTDDQETMLVQAIEYEDKSGELTLSGRALGALLDDVIIPRPETIRGNLEIEMSRLVQKYAISGDQHIKRLQLGDLHGYTETVDTQITGVSLQEMLYTLLTPKGMSWRLWYDYETDVIYFDVLKGKDRTQEQSDNAWAIFSTSRENFVQTEYKRDEEDYKNYAYVAGAGEGNDRVIVEVDQRGGERKRAIYVDARDIQPEEGEDVDRWAMCGWGGHVAISTDGINWTSYETPTTETLYGVSHANGKYLVVGEGGAIVVSEDGINWRKATSGTTQSIEGALYHDGLYIAVGGQEGGVILTSINADTWQLQTQTAIPYLRDIVYASGQYVICCAWSRMLLSEDASHWREAILEPWGLWMGDIIYDQEMGLFVSVGKSGVIMTSKDAVTWEHQQSGVTVELEAIARGAGIFVVVGMGGVILTSSDAKTWTQRSSGMTDEITGVAYGNGKFIASSWGAHCLRSNDGITWEQFDNPHMAAAGNIGFGVSPYKYRLIKRGMEKLAKYKRTESVTGVAAPGTLPRIGIDYDMGDRCDFEHAALGLSYQDIVTGIDKVYEAGEQSVTPVFGEQHLNLRQLISREVDKK